MLKREPYIDLVIGPQSYHKINDTILKHTKQKKKIEETEFDPISKFDFLNKIKNENKKVSSFLIIIPAPTDTAPELVKNICFVLKTFCHFFNSLSVPVVLVS